MYYWIDMNGDYCGLRGSTAREAVAEALLLFTTEEAEAREIEVCDDCYGFEEDGHVILNHKDWHNANLLDY